jgi:single-strand DNA-binding protein
MNVVVLRGRLTSDPAMRELQSGSVLVSLEVSTPVGADERANTPVAWFDPPRSSSVANWSAGEEVVVLGSVRRRFYRSAGGTQSRTEVVASTVVKAASARSVERLLADALRCLGEGRPHELPSA